MNDATTTLEQLRQLMAEFVAERQWQQYHTPRNLAASIAVEAGELLELFQWLTPQEVSEKAASDPVFRGELADEMADVMMYLLSLANASGIDLAAAVESKHAKARQKYPAEQYQGRYERPRKNDP